MPTKIVQYRHQAFLEQAHRCYYCDFLMWESDPEAFANTHGISLVQAQRFKCTAEHLVARSDGGTDARANIVAACLHCNQTRHRMKPAPTPDALRQLIFKQLRNKSWHRRGVARKLSSQAGLSMR